MALAGFVSRIWSRKSILQVIIRPPVVLVICFGFSRIRWVQTISVKYEIVHDRGAHFAHFGIGLQVGGVQRYATEQIDLSDIAIS